jgi:hypothetical protein
MCLLNSIDSAYLEKREDVHLETPNLQEGFLTKTTHLSQGNNELEAPASNIDGFLSRDKCGSSTLLNRPIWKTMSLFQPRKHLLQKVYLSKLTQFS